MKASASLCPAHSKSGKKVTQRAGRAARAVGHGAAAHCSGRRGPDRQGATLITRGADDLPPLPCAGAMGRAGCDRLGIAGSGTLQRDFQASTLR